jgi:energy-coupling factor transporter ATP-binding protein EcfA2
MERKRKSSDFFNQYRSEKEKNVISIKHEKEFVLFYILTMLVMNKKSED